MKSSLWTIFVLAIIWIFLVVICLVNPRTSLGMYGLLMAFLLGIIFFVAAEVSQ